MTLAARIIPATSFRVGDLQWYVASFATSGEIVVKPRWLGCNGALVLITTYQNLFNQIGHAYNPAGPGINPGGGQFYLPNYTDGRTFIPRGASRFPTRGTIAGVRTVALDPSGSQDAFHQHTYNNQFGSQPSSGVGPLTGAEAGAGLGAHVTLGSGGMTGTGAAAAHQNMPPVRVIGGIIIMF